MGSSPIQVANLSIKNGSIAQLGERLPYKQDVIGSIPIVPTKKFFGLWDYRTTWFASVAQSVEQRTENPCVGGSIPPGGTRIFLQKKICGSGSVVERHLAKVNVASSNLVFRSKDALLRLFYTAP